MLGSSSENEEEKKEAVGAGSNDSMGEIVKVLETDGG